MEKEIFNSLSRMINDGFGIEFDTEINNKPYRIYFLNKDYNKNINIPSILCIPSDFYINNQIIMESSYIESDMFSDIVEHGFKTCEKLASLTHDVPGPILVPLISNSDCQTLSRSSFTDMVNDDFYRVDEQIVRLIDKVKDIIEKKKYITVKDKIFLNGNLESGVFANRFALLQPKVVDTLCVGNVLGEIPVPNEILSSPLIYSLKYPLGTYDFQKLTGKSFDTQNYANIKFRYYVNDYELDAMRKDVGPLMNDIPEDVNKMYQVLFGKEAFARDRNVASSLCNSGIDIEYTDVLDDKHFVQEVYSRSLVDGKEKVKRMCK